MIRVRTNISNELLNIKTFTQGEVHRFQFHFSNNSLGVPWIVPLIVLRRVNPAPILGRVNNCCIRSDLENDQK